MELVQPHIHHQKASVLTRIFSAAGILIVSAAVFVVTYFNPVTAGFFPVCPFYAATGLACPGCGMTRGFHALFHGDILGALDFNALIPFYFSFFAYIGISMFLVLTRGRGLSFNMFKPRLVYGFIVVFGIFAIVRNLPLYPFTVLAP